MNIYQSDNDTTAEFAANAKKVRNPDSFAIGVFEERDGRKHIRARYYEAYERLRAVKNRMDGWTVMNYFLSEEQRKASGGTLYFEFQKGKHKNKFWLKDSMCIHADLFDKLMLFQLFADSLGAFDYYGSNNVIKKEQWNKIVEKSKENKHWQPVIEELMSWAEECFAKHDCFTVCGI